MDVQTDILGKNVARSTDTDSGFLSEKSTYARTAYKFNKLPSELLVDENVPVSNTENILDFHFKIVYKNNNNDNICKSCGQLIASEKMLPNRPKTADKNLQILLKKLEHIRKGSRL